VKNGNENAIGCPIGFLYFVGKMPEANFSMKLCIDVVLTIYSAWWLTYPSEKYE